MPDDSADQPTQLPRPALTDAPTLPPSNPIPPSDAATLPPDAPNPDTGTLPQGPGRPSWCSGPEVVPGYETLGELGRGGMGVVYKARDTQLNRTVALKMVLSGAHADQRELVRFLAEAEAVAAVKHPNVVQVFRYGEHEGRPFMALEFCEGGTLSGRIKASKQLTPRDAAEMVEKVARGVQAAHELGIVHRDLKPANVLLDKDGEPKVTDFGLAKRVGATGMTQTNAVMGTPAYMAPEQARGQTKFVGPGADVYALGVILYECLAGRPPFEADDMVSLIMKVAEENPPSLSQFVAGVPRDLELICGKCLAREARERYSTAGELADDLRRFWTGEAVSVRPPGRLELVAKWAKRKPTLAAAYGLSTVAVLLAAVVFVIFGYWRSAEAAREEAVRLQGIADAGRAEEAKLRGIANVALLGEAAAKQEVAFLNYAHAVDLAFRETQANNFARARELLDSCPIEFRRWEWHYIHRLCYADLLTLPDANGHAVRASFSPDGSRVIASSSKSDIRIWDADSGQLLSTTPRAPDQLHYGLSPDSHRVLTVNLESYARILDRTTGKQVAVLGKLGGFVRWGIFSPDGSRVAVCVKDHPLRIWETESGQLIATIEDPIGVNSTLRIDPAFSPDSKRIAFGWGEVARVRELASGREIASFKGHTKRIHSLSFSSDGERIVTTSSDGTARVWNAASGVEVAAYRGEPDQVPSAGFSPNGQRVVSTLYGGNTTVWDATTGKTISIFRFRGAYNYDLRFSPDGRRIVAAHNDGTATVWEADSGREITTLRGHTAGLISAAFSPNGRRIITTSQDGTARVWDADGQNPRTFTEQMPVTDWILAASPQYQRIATKETTNEGGRVAQIWDSESGRVIATLRGHEEAINGAAFSGDGRRVLTCSTDNTARIWETDSGRLIATLKGHTARVTSGSFSADGQRVTTTSFDRAARIWDANTGQPLGPVFIVDGDRSKFSPTIFASALSTDGGRLITYSSDGMVRIWDANSGKELVAHKNDDGLITNPFGTGMLSLDGDRVAIVGIDNTILVRDLKSWKLLLTLPRLGKRILDVAFSPDGSQLLATGTDIDVLAKPDRVRSAIYDSRPVNRAFVKPPVPKP